MFATLVLLTLAPAAPVPKPPPPPPPAVEVFAKRYAHPPRITDLGNGQVRFENVDDGYYVEVTILNTSKEPIALKTPHGWSDCIYMKVTDAKGAEVSKAGHHKLYLCSSIPQAVELKPGESTKVVVHLLREWPHPARKPGKYTATVVFAAGAAKAEAEGTFELEVSP